MIPLARALHAESLKLKRTLAIQMVFVAPLLVAALQFMIVLKRRAEPKFVMWDTLANVSLSAWAVFIYPLLITLITALINGIDHAEKNWKHIFALPIPRHSVYTAKFLVAQTLSGASTLVLVLLTLLTGLFFVHIQPGLAAAGPPPYGWLLQHAAMVWLASWLVVAIQTWVSIRWSGFALACGVGIGGTFFAIFAAGARVGAYYPWLLPANVLAPERVRTAVLLGVAGGLAAAVIGCREFIRRDVI